VGLPLIAGFEPGTTIGWSGGKAISAGQFCAAAASLARTLPAKRFVLNLCNDRLGFMLAFAAALLARQVSLLPQSKAIGTLRDLRASHPDSYCVTDGSTLPAGVPAILLPPWTEATTAQVPAQFPAQFPEIPAESLAQIAFTSGSTGQAQPHAKTWGTLVTAAQLLGRRLGIRPEMRACVLGTVPPQHVYGHETTVMLPMQNGMAVHGAQPLLPADIAAALNELPEPRWIATTPTHLRACVAADLELLPVAGVLSATMPLPVELAAAAEKLARAPLHEIYGCTEIGVVALRRTVDTQVWTVSEGMRLEEKGGAVWAEGGQLPAAVRLPDRLALESATRFTLLGRPEDMVKIAGKRASLEELNRELLRVRGVRDGAFFLPAAGPGGAKDPRQRLAAVAVAPEADAKEILRALRERLDPAFLPRPLLIVDALPRNATGKLPREALLALLQGAGARGRRSA
jgi:acyl-coenzyme A synthetase/AMP-(fatty) acid ligase